MVVVVVVVAVLFFVTEGLADCFGVRFVCVRK